MPNVNRTYTEPSRDISVLGTYDVIVCGGGPAGCAAAIASAQHGASTLVLETEGYFGGATVSQLERSYLLDTSAQIGLRSSRRLHGLATVTEEDARGFQKYADSIARSSWNIDIWPADSYTAPAVDHASEEFKKRRKQLVAGEYFDIRYGCIVAAGVDNLLMAGRCISAEHVAESSLRIQQTCMSTGQAAGVAAALSLQANTCPRELDPQEVVAQLAKDRRVEPLCQELANLPLAKR